MPVLLWMAFTASANCSASRDAMMGVAPSAAKAWAMAKPMPREPPVTSTRCPFKFKSMGFLRSGAQALGAGTWSRYQAEMSRPVMKHTPGVAMSRSSIFSKL